MASASSQSLNKCQDGSPRYALVEPVARREPELQPEVAGGGRWTLAGARGASNARFDSIASGILGLVERCVGSVQQFLNVGRNFPGSDP
jgi:hypothetical protein